MQEGGFTESGAVPQAHEETSIIERFPLETRLALEKAGYGIYELTGKTYDELVKLGGPDVEVTKDFSRPTSSKRKLSKTGDERSMDLLDQMRSRRTEVAVPQGLTMSIPNNGNLEKEFSGAQAVEGSAVDWIEVGIEYARRSDGISPFDVRHGRDEDHYQITTSSPGLSVGSFAEETDRPVQIYVTNKPGVWGAKDFSVPLIVPKNGTLGPRPVAKILQLQAK